MKKLVALLLALLLALSVSAFAGEQLPDGKLYMNGQTETEATAKVEKQTGLEMPDLLYFDNLSSMLLALKAGRIGKIWISESTARYIFERNEDIAEPEHTEISVDAEIIVCIMIQGMGNACRGLWSTVRNSHLRACRLVRLLF